MSDDLGPDDLATVGRSRAGRSTVRSHRRPDRPGLAAVRRPGRRRGDHRRRRGPRRRLPGAVDGPGRAGRLRLGHVVGVVQAGPRRAALREPGRAGTGGPGPGRAPTAAANAPHLVRALPFVLPLTGARPRPGRSAPPCGSTTWPEGPASARSTAGCRWTRPAPGCRRCGPTPSAGPTSTSTPTPTTPASPSPWSAPPSSTTGPWPPTTPPVVGAAAEPVGTGGRGPGGGRRRGDRGAGGGGGQRRRRVVGRGGRAGGRRAGGGRADHPPGQGGPPHRAPVAAAGDGRGRAPGGLRRAVGLRHPLARHRPGLHRHHRHRLRRRRRPGPVLGGRRRLPAGRGQPVAVRPPHPGRRGRLLGRAATAGGGRGRAGARPTCPAATGCRSRRAAWSPSPAASSRPTGRWRPTPSTTWPACWAPAPAAAPPPCACGAPRPAAGRRRRPATAPRRAWSGPWWRPTARSANRWSTACPTCGRRWCMPSATRWPVPSGTCSTAACGPASSTVTGRPRPRPTSPPWSGPELGWSRAESDANVAAYRAVPRRGAGPRRPPGRRPTPPERGMTAGDVKLRIDWEVVVRSAALALAVAVPAIVLGATVARDSNVIVLLYFVLLGGQVAAGWYAGRHRLDAPLVHGALASLTSFVVLVVVVVGGPGHRRQERARPLQPGLPRLHGLLHRHLRRPAGVPDEQAGTADHPRRATTAAGRRVSHLVVDVGTSGVRAAIVGADASVSHVHHRQVLPTTPNQGFVEFDAAVMAAAALDVARAALPPPAGRWRRWASPTNGRRRCVWDRATGEPVGPGIGWQDLRTAGMCLGLQAQGIHVPPSASATKLAVLLDIADPDRERDLCFGTIDTWMAWTLSGGDAARHRPVQRRRHRHAAARLLRLGLPRARRPPHPGAGAAHHRRLVGRGRRGLGAGRGAAHRRDRRRPAGVAHRPGLHPPGDGQDDVRHRRDGRPQRGRRAAVVRPPGPVGDVPHRRLAPGRADDVRPGGVHAHRRPGGGVAAGRPGADRVVGGVGDGGRRCAGRRATCGSCPPCWGWARPPGTSAPGGRWWG